MPITEPDWRHIHRDLLAIEFRQLRHYSEVLENLLETEANRLTSDLIARSALLTGENWDEFWEDSEDDYRRVHHFFPNVLRYSLFVHCYSLLEHGLLRLASHFKSAQKLALSPTDLRDEGITRAKTYLKKVAGVAFPDTTTAWQDISTLNHIRNVIVHRNGIFPDDHSHREQVEALIAKWTGAFARNAERRFEFAPEFIERVISTFETFFAELFANLHTSP